MEYDRALYRVYERIMEDLNASPSPLALTTTSSSTATTSASTTSNAGMVSPSSSPRSDHRGGLRHRRRNRNQGQGDESDATSPASSMGGDDGEPNEFEARGQDDDDDDGNGNVPTSPESQRSTSSTNDGDDDPERRRGRTSPRQQAAVVRRIPILTMQQQQHGRRHEPIPFILPIWMARKLDTSRMMNTMTTRMADSNNWGVMSQLWSTIRGALPGSRGGDGSYDTVATSPTTHASQPRILSTHYQALSLSPGGPSSPPSSSSHHRDSEHEHDNNLEQGDHHHQLQQLPSSPSSSPSGSSSDEGLRRRSSPTRRGGGGGGGGQSFSHEEQHQNNASSPPSNHSTLLQPSLAGEDTNNNSGGAMTTSLAQRAIQTQLRQNERFSSQRRRQRRRSTSISSNDMESDHGQDTDGEDTSSSDEDDDDDNDNRHNHNNNNRSNNEGCSQTGVYNTMRLSFGIAIFHIFVLISLHVTYVGPYAFARQKQQGRTMYSTNVVSGNKQRWKRNLMDGMDYFHLGHVRRLLPLLGDELEAEMQNDIDKDTTATTTPMLINCISYALSTRPVEDRSTYFGDEDEEDEDDSDGSGHGGDGKRFLLTEDDDRKAEKWDDDDDNDETFDSHIRNYDDAIIPPAAAAASRFLSEMSTVKTTKTAAHPSRQFLLGKDEILQIKIVYGGNHQCDHGTLCSRVRRVNYPADKLNIETTGQDTNSTTEEAMQNNDKRHLKTKDDDSNNGTHVDDELSSPSYWETVHYRYAMDDALLFLDETSAFLHNVTLVNVTVTERCLSTGSDDGKLTFLTAIGEFLSQIYGMDSIIINQLMYGIRGTDGASFTSGYVKSVETQERWGWHKEQMETFEDNSFVEWVLKKIGIMLMSALAFFLITSVTSLIVRVLTSSGVVLMFPLFTCFRAMGMPGADERILSLSYPWIGSARVAISNQRVHPQSHLVWAHVTKIVLYYVMYEACQAAWSVVLYAKSIPEALPVWIYGFAMIWEYFSMVFVRSALSVHFFPRVTFLYFFLYHVYFYSVPYGYFDVALIPLFLLMVHAMLYTIVALEAPNSARGVITVECPREVYNRLSWQEPVMALPAEWTMFLPLNSRLSPLHDRVSNGAPPNSDVDNGRNRETAGSDDGGNTARST